MTRARLLLASAVTALSVGVLSVGVLSSAAMAQTPYGSPTATTGQQNNSRQEQIGAVLGALFGDRLGVGAGASLDSQWALGRTPLLNQRTQFDARIDSDVRSGAINTSTGTRLKSDFAALVALETRYGADGRFTTQERSDLNDRYGVLTQVMAEGGYGDNSGPSTSPPSSGGDQASVAAERRAFEARVDAAVAARRLTRTEATRLKTDYVALITVEAGYLRDGVISARERDDLDSRLDALDARVGDVAYGGGSAPVVLTPQARLDGIARALPSSGLSATAQAQLRVEHEDLTRLAAAYARFSVTADDRAYLDRRLADLETRARVRR